MTARVLDGRPLAAEVRAAVTARATAVASALGRSPALVAILVGDDPANLAYAEAKARAAARCGIEFRLERLDAAEGTARVAQRVAVLGNDPGVDAILVELPLPAGYDRPAIEAAIHPARDADGVTAVSLGHLLAGTPGPVPATAQAALALIRHAGVALAGADAVVIGRSVVVGKPVALLLMAAHATVTVAHSRTRDLAAVTRRAEVVVAAAGVPGLVTPEHVRPGAVVIDVGTTMVGEGEAARLVGDVAYAAVAEVAGALTPVPGGVGPLTTALLLGNAVGLAEIRAGLVPPAPA